MKSRQKTLGVEEKIRCNVTLVMYIQFMIIMVELKQVLCQER